jgi:hypothetical protein
MRKALAVATVAALAFAACSSKDRYLPKFDAAQKLATVAGPVTLAVSPSGEVFYGVRATGNVYSAQAGRVEPDLVVHFDTDQLDSIAVEGRSTVYAAYHRRPDGHVVIDRFAAGSEIENIRVLAASPEPVNIAVDAKRRLLIGIGNRIESIDPVIAHAPAPKEISSGWANPRAFVPGRGDRIWVADDAPKGEKERVARGGETNKAKRRRFATVLPKDTDPSGVALRDDELLVCSEHYGTVYRLHIGLDDVARRRAVVEGLECKHSIVAAPDRSVITATSTAIYRYPPRR